MEGDVRTTALTSTKARDSLRYHRFSATARGEMTPPLTPAVSSEDLTFLSESQSAPFPNYLRAIYPFHPPCDSSTDTVTLPLNEGDIILIHSVHSNGWADGTLLDTAHRGWLPTNYCEEFDLESVRTLLNALTNFWDSASEGGDGTVAIVHGHNLTQGLVAGVRCLLAATDCLKGDAALLSKDSGHSGLRRNRKVLLSDLSELVKFFKTCEPVVVSTEENFLSEDDLSQLVLKAFNIIVRAVKFCDVWSEQSGNEASFMAPSETSFALSEQSDSPVEDRESTDHSAASATGVNHEDLHPPQTIYRHSIARNRNSSLRSSLQTPKCVYHRISWLTNAASQRDSKLASSRLISAHESFLSFLGSFLSIHLTTQTAVEVLVSTQQAVNAGRYLLTVVEAVWDRGLCKSKSLEEARDAMYTRITQLVFAAQQIFSATEQDDSEHKTRKELADTALSCIRGATECVDATRGVLELIGDFEFETIEEPVFSEVDFEVDDFVESRESSDLTMVQDFPLPPDNRSQTPPPDAQLTPTHKTLQTSVIELEESDISTPSSRLSASSIIQAPPSLTDGSSVGDFSPLSPVPENSISHEPRKQSLTDLTIETASPIVSSSSDDRMAESWSASTLAHSESSVSLSESALLEKQSTLDGDIEEDVMRTTYAHELVFNKDGQISGGTLPALVERLTTSDSRPDHIFLSSFFMTFRLFTTPECLAKTLVDRYQYIGEFQTSAPVVRLRIYNVFKTWIEANWRKESDTSALPIIETFAKDNLIFAYPSASKRLLESIASISGQAMPRSLKSRASLEQLAKSSRPTDATAPASAMSKSQMAVIKSWQQGHSKPQITDFEPLEIARQLTLKASTLFCAIQAEELLATEWTKKTGSHATNVRAMSTLSTDLTNLVAETILQHEEHAKRAKVIKHWLKVANKCLELDNYDSLMAIICSINSTPVLRLKKTWDCLNSKPKALFEHLKSIVDCSKNYTNLRQRLATLATPALPFLGVYLTDLTFVEAGNATTRNLPGSASRSSVTGINFDKHAKTAKIIFELQRFQHPYNLQEVPEFQAWLQSQFIQVRCSLDNGNSSITKLYRRSCTLEPRTPSTTTRAAGSKIPRLGQEKTDFLTQYFGV